MTERPMGPWVRMQASAWLDPAIIRARPSAELLFYRSLMYAKLTTSGGHVPDIALTELARGLHRRPAVVDALLNEGLWVVDSVSGGCRIANYSKYNPETSRQRDDDAGQGQDRPRKRSSRKSTKADGSLARAQPDAPSSKTDRQTDIVTDRTPSGSVRSVTARTAPRGSGGAAQPAPPDGVCLAADEAQAVIRQQIEKAKTKRRPAPIVEPEPANPHRDRAADEAAFEKLKRIAESLGGDSTGE